jgi:hypothetical protein
MIGAEETLRVRSHLRQTVRNDDTPCLLARERGREREKVWVFPSQTPPLLELGTWHSLPLARPPIQIPLHTCA